MTFVNQVLQFGQALPQALPVWLAGTGDTEDVRVAGWLPALPWHQQRANILGPVAGIQDNKDIPSLIQRRPEAGIAPPPRDEDTPDSHHPQDAPDEVTP